MYPLTDSCKESISRQWKVICYSYNEKQTSIDRQIRIPFVPSRRSIRRFYKAIKHLYLSYLDWKQAQDNLYDMYERERYGYEVDDMDITIQEEEDFCKERLFYNAVRQCHQSIAKHKIGNGFLLCFKQESFHVADPKLDTTQMQYLHHFLSHLPSLTHILYSFLETCTLMDTKLVAACILEYEPDLISQAFSFVKKTLEKEIYALQM